ncbi:iron-sulfur cluster biosynthesis family protein [Peribacillus frigoritolerans]|uniref:iron-sulfur cluster biosynthesis family protein n=1 Tax=Peribacillus frigoritolerans TaxID=450367 RepID=UPI002079501F|nr:iron-sulfur cluster biosynthesis family protein [Peribacillus frigoritolerans]USK67586.1 iron-sulfur cluster biosynthesis family protein [Peribacillus frigoritolerans]
MIVKITEAAMNKLKEMTRKDAQIPRIDADIAGGCGVSVKFSLLLDEPRRNDVIIEYEGVQLRLDSFTKRYLDEETQIDYIEDSGFIVGESFASSACAIEIN